GFGTLFLDTGRAFELLSAVLAVDAVRPGRLFLIGRLPEARILGRFESEVLACLRFRAFRLAIDFVLSNLDSLTISVVLSVAYRNSGGRLLKHLTPSPERRRRPPDFGNGRCLSNSRDAGTRYQRPARERPGGPVRHVERR